MHERFHPYAKSIFPTLAMIFGLSLSPVLDAHATPVVGSPAPEFAVASADGEPQSLARHRGKYVVLEWLNHECPYVRKHYDSGNLQRLQAGYTGKGVVWLSVISSAPGKQGHATAAQALAAAETKGAKPSAILLDEKGEVGKLYGATTTPHMYVIDPDGTLIYMGAIDDQPSFDKTSIDGATNWVEKALDEAMAGQPVTTSSTKQYGCAVKY